MASLQPRQSTSQWWSEWQRAVSAGRTLTRSWKLRKQPSIGQQESTETPRKKNKSKKTKHLVKHEKNHSHPKLNEHKHRNLEPVPRPQKQTKKSQKTIINE